MELYQLAKEAIEKHGDIDSAVNAVMKRIKKDPELIRECIHRACQSVVWSARTNETRTTKANSFARSTGGIASVAGTMTAAFLDTFYCAGRRLGDCSRDDLLAEATERRAEAKGHIHTADFLERLAGMVPADKPVRACVSHDEASKLYAETGKTKPTKRKRPSQRPAAVATA